jgi:hypothetical protein
MGRAHRHAVTALLLVVFLSATSVLAAPGVAFQTSVPPRPDEDIAEACGYELTLLDPARTIRGVWVVFDRGRDMLRYYGDPDVQAFARLELLERWRGTALARRSHRHDRHDRDKS